MTDSLITETTPARVINGRYRFVRELGSGGMGSVYLVLDELQDERPLALKRVRGDVTDKRIAATLQNEFLTLARLQHPGLATVYDFGVDRESRDYFFTCEFVDGASLLKACKGLRLEEEGDLHTFLDLIAQILRGLEFIHSHGLVHGDIKPENILITGISDSGTEVPAPTPDSPPEAKLIDFGLTRRAKGFGGKKVIGTTYYIAPETIMGSQVDRRTDLYSLGCVLYQVMTGRLPFGGDNNLAILKGHMEKAPIPPAELRPDLPEAVSDIVLRLMEKKPAGRFQNALEALEAMTGMLGRDFPFETQETSSSYLLCARPVTARPHLATLCSAFSMACKVEFPEADKDLNLSFTEVVSASVEESGLTSLPAGQFILLRGEEGIGKRWMVEDFKNLVQTQGGQFLRIHCERGDSEAPAPAFRRLLETAERLIPAGEEPPEVLRTCAEMSPDDLAEKRRSKVLAPLEELAKHLQSLSHEQPIVIHLDDLQKADPLLLSFVAAMVSCQVKKVMPFNRLLLTACAGDRGDPEGQDLRRLLRTPTLQGAFLDVSLSRLDLEGVRLYTEAICAGHDFPDSFVRQVFEGSDGNPAMVGEIIQILLERGDIRRTAAGWSLREDCQQDAIPGTVRRQLKEHIEKLPRDTLRLAIAYAYLGNSTEVELALRLAGTDREAMLESMKVLCAERILEEDPADGRLNVYSFVHSSAQEMLYRLVPSEKRAELHERAGRLSEEYYGRAGREEPRRLAGHFLKAGNRDQGTRYGMVAAGLYAKEFALRKALDTYAAVLELNEGYDQALSNQVRFEMGRLHRDLGEYHRALESLRGIEAGESGQPPGVHPTRWLIEMALNLGRLGEFEEASRLLAEAATREKKQLLPVWMVHVLAGYADLFLLLGRHADSLKYCNEVQESLDQIHDKGFLVRLFLMLAENHFHLGRRDQSIRFCLDALKLVDSATDTEHLDTIFFIMGCFYRYSGKYSKAAGQFRMCASIRKKRGLLDGRGEALLELGATDLLLGRPRRACLALEQARAIHEKTDNVPAGGKAFSLLGEAHALLGEYEDARKCLTESLRLAKKTGNNVLVSANYAVCGKICLDHGDHENAEKYFADVEARSREEAGELLRVLEYRCQQAVECARYEDALSLAKSGIDLSRKSGIRMRSVPFLELRGLVELRIGARERAKRTAESLIETARRYGLVLHVGRGFIIQGLVAALEENREKVAQSFHEAAKIFQAEESERDLVHLYLQQALLLLDTGQHEQIFLYLEEASYLAKKLNLAYWKCRVQHVMALFELQTALEGGAKARENFLHAERYARGSSYLDVLWQIQFQLGCLSQKAGNDEEALQHFDAATTVRQQVLEGIRSSFRKEYLEVSRGRELDYSREECAHRLQGAALAPAAPSES